MKITKENLIQRFDEVINVQLNAAIKYQDKFSLTLENLKCLNPDCNRMRKWGTSTTIFYHTCGNDQCKKMAKPIIDKIKKEKSILTYFNKTGYNFSNQNPESKNKRKITNLKKYDSEYPIQNKEIKEKLKKTYIQRYNVDNPMKVSNIKEKLKDSNFAKYGVDNPMKVSNIKEKHSLYYKKKNHLNSNITNFQDWDNKDFWINNFITKDNNFDYIKCMSYFNCGIAATYQKIKKLGIKYIKFGPISNKELRIVKYLQTQYNFEIIQNNRQIVAPYELDIYIPNLKLAIEYNGIYWHSYHETVGTSPQQTDLDYMKTRHQLKALACLNKGIRLLNLYEDQDELEYIELISNFINNSYTVDTEIFILDHGCYPINIDFEIIEPTSRIVLNNRLLWDAGKIKRKG